MSRISPLPLRLLLLGVLVVVAAACGKRGPPLPPLRPAPDKVTSLAFLRRDLEITVSFVTPIRNADGSELRFDHVEIYALSAPAGVIPPTLKKILVPANRVAVLGKRAATVAPPTAEPPPGPDAAPVGVPLTFTERVTLPAPPVMPIVPIAPKRPIVLAPLPLGKTLLPEPVAATPVVASVLLPGPTRFYVVVPYANGSRAGTLSDVVGVPLGPSPLAPHDAAITYDQQTLTLAWVAGATGQSFHVYDATAPVAGSVKPLTPAALTAAEFKRPVVFGTRVCFVVRGARTTGPVTLESAGSNVACAVPADTFPPAAPTGVTAFAATGAITLTWDAVAAADLSGYLILRGEGTGDRLQPLTPAPVTGTSFTDSTTRPGVRYVYAVVAVDNATPANRSKESNRVEETGR